MRAEGTEPKMGAEPPALRLSGTHRIWAFNALLAGGALALYLGVIDDLPRLRAPIEMPWLVLAAMFYLSEIFVVHLQFRRDAHSISLSEIPLVLGLFFASPGELVTAQLVGALLALMIHRRQSALKLAFNTSHLSLEAGLAALVFHSIVGAGDPIGPAGWVATLVATLVATIFGALMIIFAISLSEGKLQPAALPSILSLAVLITMTNTSLALAGAMILWLEPRAAWLLLVPTGILFLTYRLYMRERQKHDSIETLYESTTAVQQHLKMDATIEGVLHQARKMFRADVAEVILLPDRTGDPELVSVLGPGDSVDLVQKMHLDPREGLWARVVSDGRPLLVQRPVHDEEIAAYFASRGLRDAMVAPLRRDGTVIGTMLVGSRLGDVSTFDEEDLKLFLTLVNHASISLENSRLVARLEDSLDRLTESNRLKDDFVASVSHELRTPLTSIQGYIKTLLRPGVTFSEEDHRSFLEAVDRQSDRLRRLIEDLLVVSRLEARSEHPKVSAFSMHELSEQVADELRDRARAHRMDLDVDPHLPLLLSDPGKVHQILGNLIENALKYTPQGTTVRVGVRKQGKGLLVSVADQGEGIPPDAQERIFERFYQIDQSSTRTVGGTGLGLYICRKLANSLGGHLWLDRSDEDGSVFNLWLPFQPPRGQSSDDVREAQLPADVLALYEKRAAGNGP